MAKKLTKFEKSARQADRLEKRAGITFEATATEVVVSRQTKLQPSTTDLEDRIRQRAYEIYEASGREQGRDLDHWLQAEAEIAGARSKDAVA